MTNEWRLGPAALDRGRLVTLMTERKLDALILTSPENVYYSTGYTVLPSSGNPILYSLRNRLPFYAIVGRDGGITLLCWGFSTEGVGIEVDELRGFADLTSALRELKAVVAQLPRGSRVGLESSCPLSVAALLDESRLRIDSNGAESVMSELRLVKNQAEVQLLRRSAEIAETTLAHILDSVQIGTGRLRLLRQARQKLMEQGASGISHLTMTFGGANPEIAFDEVLTADRLATLDVGAIFDGYFSDVRRYAYSGRVPGALQERYDVMVSIVDEIGEAMKPGTSYSELFGLGVRLFERHLLPVTFNHVGHHIGLETEERWIDDSAAERIRAGMVIALELYSMTNEGFRIGNEETYVVGDAGAERITKLPRVLRALG